MEQLKRELPNSTIVLVLGILSLVFCCLYGLVSFILAIISLVMSGSAKREYLIHPEHYTESSYKNVNAGRICAIIAICITVCVFFMLFTLVAGAIAFVVKMMFG